MSYHVETVIVGAGVIGLAIAQACAKAGQDVLVLERNTRIGEEISARNSEVIHAGLYYPKNSLKARFCVAGRQHLYDWCDKHAVAHHKCGKWVIATNQDESLALETLFDRGQTNGVDGLHKASRAEIGALSQYLRLDSAFFSRETGIIDSHGLMSSFEGILSDHGGAIALDANLVSATRCQGQFRLQIANEGQNTEIHCDRLINAAGLWAPMVARNFDFLPEQHQPQEYFCRGHYFSYLGRVPFQSLIYPMPQQAGLGVHLTLDMAGLARFGPDVDWIDEPDYKFRPGRKKAFIDAVRRYWPGIDASRLIEGYTGIRPKLVGPGQAAADFRIDGPTLHAVPGLVNLFGIESPGLTSCLAIADHVQSLLQEQDLFSR